MTKRHKRYVTFWSFVIVLFTVPCSLLAFTSPGNPTGYVNDFAQVLTVEQKNALENKLGAFNASTTNDIAIVTVKSLEGDYIEHYATELFQAWGIGTKKHDNGVLLLIALDDRKMRIEVGYGLEGSLTDSISSEIIRNDLTPAFKGGDYYDGIDRAIDDVMKVTQGEYSRGETASSGEGFSLEGIFIFVVIVLQFFGAILGRSKSWWAGGVIGGVVGVIATVLHVLGVSFVIGSVMTVILVLLGLLFDYVVSTSYQNAVARGGGVPWWVGGSRGFGGGSGGSSFGGFGGGRSGGGGASGSW